VLLFQKICVNYIIVIHLLLTKVNKIKPGKTPDVALPFIEGRGRGHFKKSLKSNI